MPFRLPCSGIFQIRILTKCVPLKINGRDVILPKVKTASPKTTIAPGARNEIFADQKTLQCKIQLAGRGSRARLICAPVSSRLGVSLWSERATQQATSVEREQRQYPQQALSPTIVDSSTEDRPTSWIPGHTLTSDQGGAWILPLYRGKGSSTRQGGERVHEVRVCFFPPAA